MKMRMTIFMKIFVVVMSLLCCSIWYISQSTSTIFEDVLMNREEYSNLNNSLLKSKEVENYFETLMKKTKAYSQQVSKKQEIDDKEIIKISFVNKSRVVSGENKKWMKNNNISSKFLKEKNKKFLKTKKVGVYNISERNFAPMGVFVFPVSVEEDYFAVVNFDLTFLQKKIRSEKNINYVVNYNGEVISHSQDENIFTKKINNKLVNKALSSKLNQEQIQYKNAGGEEVIGAFFKSKKYGVVAVSEISKKLVLEPVKRARNSSIYIAGIVFSLAIFICFLLATSVTGPVRKLSKLFKEVAKGDLTVSSKGKIKPIFKDEISSLAETFDTMVVGLNKGRKVENLMQKFQGQAVTEDLLEKEIKLGGEKKNVVVFFSDIRGFTSYTEKTEAEEVVSMLNDYFKVMVGIILNRKGVVDKFIGDAIMAAWGIPTEQEHANKNAVMACLEMRKALMLFNERRIKEGKEPIMIGMGLHKGMAISGVVGSEDKMEYTIIGDTVNQAARIEEGTKAFGTDLLISEEVYNEVKDDFVIEEAGKVEAKGKSKPLTLYKVLGYVKDGEQKIVETPYSTYEAKDGGKVKKTA